MALYCRSRPIRCQIIHSVLIQMIISRWHVLIVKNEDQYDQIAFFLLSKIDQDDCIRQIDPVDKFRFTLKSVCVTMFIKHDVIAFVWLFIWGF